MFALYPFVILLLRGRVFCSEYEPIAEAILSGDVEEFAKVIVQKPYLINACDEKLQQTPLIHALHYKREEMCEILLKNGAEWKTTVDWPEDAMATAINCGMGKIVKELLKNGVKPTETVAKGATTTYLHLAASNGDSDVMEMMCVGDVNLEVKNELGCTPLHEACLNRRHGEKVIDILLRAKAEVNARNKNFDTPLHYAVRMLLFPDKSNESALDSLLSVEGVDADPENREGETPLMIAAEYDNEYAVGKLLAAGADVKRRNYRGKTILHNESARRNEVIVRLAKSYGFDFEAADNYGRTALLYAGLSADKIGIDALIKAGADVRATNARMEGVAHYALSSPRATANLMEFLTFFGVELDSTKPEIPPLPWRNLWRSGRRGGRTLNVLLEAGMKVSKEEMKHILVVQWSKCYEIVSRGEFVDFRDVLLKATAAHWNNNANRLDGDSRSLAEKYDDVGMFALYKVLKKAYDKKEPATGLELRAFAIFDHIVEEISKGTYLRSLPLELSSDVILANSYYGWKLQRLAWNLALASHNLNYSLEEGCKLAIERAFSNTFAPVV